MPFDPTADDGEDRIQAVAVYRRDTGDAIDWAALFASVAAPAGGGVFTNRSIANLSGASEVLMAANTARRVLIVVNEGAAAVAVNLTGGTAALNTAGSVTLAAGGNMVLDSYVPTSAITIIGTLNADVTTYEG